MSNASDSSIRRAASRLRLGVFGVMALVVLIYLAAWLDVQIAHAHVEHRLEGIAGPYATAIGAGSLGLLLIALFRLSQMLGRLGAGELFSDAVIRHFRGFALWLLLMAAFELVAPIVIGLGTAGATYPHRLRIGVDLRDLLTLGITLLLFLIANLLERARRLDEEMREFV